MSLLVSKVVLSKRSIPRDPAMALDTATYSSGVVSLDSGIISLYLGLVSVCLCVACSSAAFPYCSRKSSQKPLCAKSISRVINCLYCTFSGFRRPFRR